MKHLNLLRQAAAGKPRQFQTALRTTASSPVPRRDSGVPGPVRTPRPACRLGLNTLLLAGGLTAGLAAAHAAPPSLQPLLQGKWPAWPRGGEALDVKVAGNYAYVADGEASLHSGGLQVIDVSDPTNCVRVGSYETSGFAWGVAVVTSRI